MRNSVDFIFQIFRSKTIYRILFNQAVAEKCSNISGTVVDIAGGGTASYYSYLPKDVSVIKTNFYETKGIDKIVDFEKPLPFGDESVDSILFFNALYIIKDPEYVLREMHRILKPGGSLFIASPFIAALMKEPHDYRRLTSEGVEELLRTSGFSSWNISSFGERWTSSVYLLHSFFIFNVVRMCVYSLALLLDKLIPTKMRVNHPAPLGYFCVVKK